MENKKDLPMFTIEFRNETIILSKKWIDFINYIREEVKFGKIDLIITNGEPDRVDKGLKQKKFGE